MALIKSISGIRGTIGGRAGEGLSPVDIARFASAYATYILGCGKSTSRTVVVGRDARISGPMATRVVCGALMGCGCDVLDIGLATTPTTELAVTMSGAAGGIIITASHNPRHWNALKLLNHEGEFLGPAEGAMVMDIADREGFRHADVDSIGSYSLDGSFGDRHVERVLGLGLVDAGAIGKAGFRVCLDAINSVGGMVVPVLLSRLGVECEVLNGEPTGDFAHDPEPLERNLGGIMGRMRSGGFDLGIVVDPDVDRLAFIQEDGRMFGEEYTLVAVADYVLENGAGNTVSNLSSTRALADVTRRHGGTHSASAVGEVNVVRMMKDVGAVIGGEGNGGVIYPECHYGRDALVGIALFLSLLARRGCRASELRASYPAYFMAKERVDLAPGTDAGAMLERVKAMYPSGMVNDADGVRIDFGDRWVHMRRSNTEPIVRVYTEARSHREAEALAREFVGILAGPR